MADGMTLIAFARDNRFTVFVDFAGLVVAPEQDAS